MTIFYRCRSKQFCEGQGRNHLCRVSGHPERLKCPNLEVVERAPMPKVSIDPGKPGVKDPDTPHFWGTPAWIVQELMRELRR